MDTPGFYKVAMKRLIRAREHALYRELDVAPVPDGVGNYTLLDLSDLSAKPFGKDFAEWLLKTVLPRESLFEMAQGASGVRPPPVDTTALSCHHKSVRRARRR